MTNQIFEYSHYSCDLDSFIKYWLQFKMFPFGMILEWTIWVIILFLLFTKALYVCVWYFFSVFFLSLTSFLILHFYPDVFKVQQESTRFDDKHSKQSKQTFNDGIVTDHRKTHLAILFTKNICLLIWIHLYQNYDVVTDEYITTPTADKYQSSSCGIFRAWSQRSGEKKRESKQLHWW